MTGLDVKQFRVYVVRPILLYLEPSIPYTMAAENLLVGTALKESGLRYLTQLPGPGPAWGVYQCEQPTFEDIYANWFPAHPDLAAKVNALAAPWPTNRFLQLPWNLGFATAHCRCQYRRSPLPLPTNADDIAALAHIWKLAWNSTAGAGTEAEWIAIYRAATQ